MGKECSAELGQQIVVCKRRLPSPRWRWLLRTRNGTRGHGAGVGGERSEAGLPEVGLNGITYLRQLLV